MSARPLAEAIVALASTVAGAADGDHGTDLDLVAALDAVGELRRRVDALGVALTARCESYRSDDGAPLATRTGVRDLATLLSLRAGLEAPDAAAWVGAAESTTPRVSLTGERLSARHPEVGDALAEGRLSASAAHRICRTLDDVAVAVDPAFASEVRRTMLRSAPDLTPRELRALCRAVLDRATPEDAQLREDALRARSGLRITRLGDGSARWTLTLDGESEGLLLTALTARTAPRRTPTFGSGSDDPDPRAIDDADAPLHRRRLDALVAIARDSLAHDPGQVAGSPVTMMVTVTLDALRSGLGTASIAGVDEPISAATARRLAADAEIIPVVLGTESVPLDLGRRFRVASPAQRRALVLRDGGCASCGAPPGWCEVAHILAWWLGGSTDLANLLLLCTRCHRAFDRDGWEVVRRDGVPWFIPPAHIDSSRTPRRGYGIPALPSPAA